MYEGIPRWTSATKYVDIETGEALTKHQYTTKYAHIHTFLRIIINKNKSHGHKEYTKVGRRKPTQGKLY